MLELEQKHYQVKVAYLGFMNQYFICVQLISKVKCSCPNVEVDVHKYDDFGGKSLIYPNFYGDKCLEFGCKTVIYYKNMAANQGIIGLISVQIMVNNRYIQLKYVP